MLLKSENTAELLQHALTWVRREGTRTSSRFGQIIQGPTPLLSQLTRPENRVVLHPERRWPPWLYMMEGLYVFTRHNKTSLMAKFSKAYLNYDVEGRIAGDYGERIADRLQPIINALKRNPDERRCYVPLWDPALDTNFEATPIVPCNVGFQFRIVDDRLHCYVFNRSNDLLWGMYGANVMQFSMLQEVVAGILRRPMGSLWQFTTNPHYYTEGQPGELCERIIASSRVTAQFGRPSPISADSLSEWTSCVERIVTAIDEEQPLPYVPNRWLDTVATPVFKAWRAWRDRDYSQYCRAAAECSCPHWQASLFLFLGDKLAVASNAGCASTSTAAAGGD
jgi:hypothetical protein